MTAWHNPETDKKWRELERRALQFELGGTLLSMPGTGSRNDKWARNEGWTQWSDQLRDVGARAVVAVKDRDLETISAVGDEIVVFCTGCHIEYKSAVSSGVEFGELSPTSSDLEEV